MLREFKQFALRGNVIDLAVGVIIGAAFGKITTSLVNDVLMPPIGKLMGNVDFSNFFVTLGPGDFTTLAEAKAAGVPTVNYGLFLNTVIDFVIVAFVMFLLVRQVNRVREKMAVDQAKTDAAPASPSEEVLLLREIRDAVKVK